MPKPRQPRPRFLAPGAGNGHGYTTRPLRELPLVADEPDMVERVADATNIRDEPEAIGPAILESYAEVNKRIFDQQHLIDVALAQQSRPLLAAEDRVRDIERRAKFAKVDLSRETHLMRRDIDRARAAGRMPPRRVPERCEGLEALLDGIGA